MATDRENSQLEMANDSSDDEEDEAIESLFSSAPVLLRKSLACGGPSATSSPTTTTIDRSPTADSAPAVTQESEDDDSSARHAAREKLELAAKKEGDTLAPSMVEKINDIEDLAWHVEQKSGKAVPCLRRRPHYEATGLHISKVYKKENMELIRYVGLNSRHADTYNSVAKSRLLPIIQPDDESHFEEYLGRFLKEMKKSQTELAEKKILVEGFLLRAIIAQVQQKTNHKNTQQQNKEQAGSGEQSQPESKTSNREEREFEIAGIASALGRRTSARDGPRRDTATVESSSDDDSIGNWSIGSTDSKAKKAMGDKESLRDGETIEYDPPLAVAGVKGGLIQATILGIQPRNQSGGHNKFPLILDNGELLPRETQVKRITLRLRGKLRANPNAAFKRIDRYRLSKCGETSRRAGLQEQGRKVAEILSKNIPDEMKDFCHSFAPKKKTTTMASEGNNDSDEGDRKPKAVTLDGLEEDEQSASSTVDDQQRRNISSKARRSLGSFLGKSKQEKATSAASKKRRRTQPIASSSLLPSSSSGDGKVRAKGEARWKQHLSGLIEKVKAQSTNRRLKPHMSVKQLGLALSVWPILEEQIEKKRVLGRTKPIEDLAEEIDIPAFDLNRFLHGDEDKCIRSSFMDEIETSLTTWLELQPTNHDSSSSLSLDNATASRDSSMDLAPTLCSSQPDLSAHSSTGMRALYEEASQPATKKRRVADKENRTEEIAETPRKKRRDHQMQTTKEIVTPGKRRSSIASTNRRRSSQSTEIARAAATTHAALHSSFSSLSTAPVTPGTTAPATPGTARRRRISTAGYQPPSVTSARKRRKESLAPASAKKRRGSISSSFSGGETPSTATLSKEKEKKKFFDWKLRLPKLIEAEKNNMATKSRRYVPHFTPGQLQRAMDVWQQLERLQHERDETLEKIITDVAEEFDNISPTRLTHFLKGDEKKFLSSQSVGKIDSELKKWLVDQEQPNQSSTIKPEEACAAATALATE